MPLITDGSLDDNQPLQQVDDMSRSHVDDTVDGYRWREKTHHLIVVMMVVMHAGQSHLRLYATVLTRRTTRRHVRQPFYITLVHAIHPNPLTVDS